MKTIPPKWIFGLGAAVFTRDVVNGERIAAEELEAADHHPDLTVFWPQVGVSLQSHSTGGITDMDIKLAKKIESAVLWRLPDASVFEGGTSKTWVRG